MSQPVRKKVLHVSDYSYFGSGVCADRSNGRVSPHLPSISTVPTCIPAEAEADSRLLALDSGAASC